MSSLDFGPTLEQFLGTGAGLSAATITRLTAQQDEARLFADRSLADVDYVCLWVDDIRLNVRLEQQKLCLLLMIGVRPDGRKELVALTDGYREPTESWADLQRDCRRRGMRAPVLAMGDGALGFWAALREVFPTTREQRCWFHKMANVRAALPKSAHPAATRHLPGTVPYELIQQRHASPQPPDQLPEHRRTFPTSVGALAFCLRTSNGTIGKVRPSHRCPVCRPTKRSHLPIHRSQALLAVKVLEALGYDVTLHWYRGLITTHLNSRGASNPGGRSRHQPRWSPSSGHLNPRVGCEDQDADYGDG